MGYHGAKGREGPREANFTEVKGEAEEEPRILSYPLSDVGEGGRKSSRAEKDTRGIAKRQQANLSSS